MKINRKKPLKNQQSKLAIKKSKKTGQNRTKSLTKNLSFFLKDFHSLTPAAVLFPLEQSLILLGQIHALGHLSNNKELVHFHSQSTMKY